MNRASATKSQGVATDDSALVSGRLPCRGCMKNCKNYSICEGRPWRTLANDRSAPRGERLAQRQLQDEVA